MIGLTMRIVLGFVLLVFAVSVSIGAVDADFSIYQRDIIDKMPFGKPPPAPVRPAPPVRQSNQPQVPALNTLFQLVAVVEPSPPVIKDETVTPAGNPLIV